MSECVSIVLCVGVIFHPMLILLSYLFIFFFSYKVRVVGNGILAQRQNPEVKVRGPDAMLAAVKERLEHFNQVGFWLFNRDMNISIFCVSLIF